jgi:hypothetical protein
MSRGLLLELFIPHSMKAVCYRESGENDKSEEGHELHSLEG